MKATISKNGFLKIESETALESYALEQWIANQPIYAQKGTNHICSDKLLFEYSSEVKE
jgi:hypothetical protein